MNNAPFVSVVIPTIGREELVRAIGSVRAQDIEDTIEIIVVFDRDADATRDDILELSKDADSVLFTGGAKGAGYARNRGIENASGSWIAFLDDDDEWLPHKLRVQFDCIDKEEGKRLVVGCRAIQRSSDDPQREQITGVPKNLIQPGQSIEEYLFIRRRPGSRRNSFFAPSIVAPRELCLAVPWDESLRRHQDWDWIVRLGRAEGVKFIQAPSDSLVVYIGSGGSISAGTDWTGSLSWAKRMLSTQAPRAYVDFLVAQPLRYALQKRDFTGVLAVVRSLAASRKIPSLRSTLVGLTGLMPRSRMESLMHRVK